METPTPSTQTPKTVQWYQPTLTQLPEPTKDLFEKYAGLETEDEIKDHITSIRNKAWQIHPYPCIGLFRFLTTAITLNPIYPQILSRLQSGQKLLDLGCCFGQDLRKLAFDAGLSGSTSNLIGVDIEDSFIQLGYELFRDRETFQGQFHSGDIFDERFLAEYNGAVDIVYLGSFLHLFTFDKQRIIVSRIGELIGPNGIVFGRCLGAVQGGGFFMETLGWEVFRHSEGTMRELWDAGEWDVGARLEGYEAAAAAGGFRGSGDWQGDSTMQMTFWVSRNSKN